MKKFLILLLSLVLVTSCGEATVTESKKSDKKEEKKEEIVEVTAQEKDQILDAVNKLHDFDLFVDDKEVKDLDNEFLLIFVTNYRFFNGISNYGDEMTLAELESTLNQLLYDVTITPDDIPCAFCGTINLKYDKKKEKFVANEEHYGHGYSDVTVFNRLKDVEYKDGKYVATVYKAISEFTDIEPPQKYYACLQDEEDDKNPIFTMKLSNDYEIIGDPKDEFLKVPDEKLVEHVYTFVKQDGNFLLESYKINK